MHYTTSCNTQSNAPEDGRNQRPKYVELIGIINKPLLLHLVGVYIIYSLRSCLHAYILLFVPSDKSRNVEFSEKSGGQADKNISIFSYTFCLHSYLLLTFFLSVIFVSSGYRFSLAWGYRPSTPQNVLRSLKRNCCSKQRCKQPRRCNNFFVY